MFHRIHSFFLKNQTTVQTITKNTVWLLGSEITSRLFRIVLVIYSARVLGASGWGVFSYVLALAGFFTFFEDAGLGTLITRELAKKTDTSKSFVATALLLKLLLLSAATLIFIFVGRTYPALAETTVLILPVAGVIFFDSLREFFLSINRAYETMEIEALVKSVTGFSIACLGILLLTFFKSPASLAWGYALGSFVGFIVAYVSVRSRVHVILQDATTKLLAPLFREAWPFTILSMTNIVIFSVDTIILGWWTGATEVGIYSAAQRLIQTFYIIPALFSSALFPVFVKKMNTAGDDYIVAIEKSLSLILSVAIPITIGTLMWTKEAIVLVFGHEYEAGSVILKILAWIIIPVFAQIVLNNFIFALGRQKSFVLINTVGMIINLGLDVLLIPHLHAVGAALAGIISLSIIVCATWLKIQTFAKISLTRYIHIPGILLAMTAMIAVTLLIKSIAVPFIIGALISTLVYCGVLVLTNKELMNAISLIFVKTDSLPDSSIK